MPWELPREQSEGVLAHELGHVQLFVRCLDGLAYDLEEGLCNLSAYLLHQEKSISEARCCIRLLEEAPAFIWGESFRCARACLRTQSPSLTAIIGGSERRRPCDHIEISKEVVMVKLPGGELAARPLHFIWVADCSGSMGVEAKIQALNNAIREAIPHMQETADGNPNAQVLVRAAKFSNGAQWHIANPTPVEQFQWQDLPADGVTDMGKAMRLIAEQLKIPPMTERALPPVLVLIFDGQPTDDFGSGLKELLSLPWGKKAVRIAIAVGKDADLDVLRKFINNPEIEPLQANNVETLVQYIRWVSTVVLQSTSQPPSQPQSGVADVGNVPIPQAPPPASADDIW